MPTDTKRRTANRMRFAAMNAEKLADQVDDLRADCPGDTGEAGPVADELNAAREHAGGAAARIRKAADILQDVTA